MFAGIGTDIDAVFQWKNGEYLYIYSFSKSNCKNDKYDKILLIVF